MIPDDRTKPDVGRHRATAPSMRILVMWEGKSRVHTLSIGQTLTVGRSATAEIQIDHPSVSRAHARILGGSPVVVDDLGSTNGMRVRDARVPKNERLPLRPGDVIEIGPALLVLQAPVSASEPGESRPTDAAEVERLLARVAPSDLTVLLLGETGSGKTRAARAVHDQSARAARAFVHLNCAAFPEALLEAELFGYERGAFTGAVAAKAGLVETADGGTLFLDEVGEMPLSTQAKLLNVLETRDVMRLGSVRPKHVDLRVVAATNRDIRDMIEAGRFREDLYFRLDGISITIPPLRERRGEIVPLAQSFLRDAAARLGRGELVLAEDAAQRLLAHPFPGNVRELLNAIERAAVLSKGAVVRASDLVLDAPKGERMAAERLGDALFDLEHQKITEALRETHGNQTHAAKRLGISRRALISRIEAYGLPRPRKR